MQIDVIGPEIEAKLDWLVLTEAFIAGHSRARAEVADVILRNGPDTLLNRSAWIEGVGIAVKAATIFPHNPERHGQAAINGLVAVMSAEDGRLEALLDFGMVTKWKTAADSLLAARLLARPDATEFLIVGAGAVARSMVTAYGAAFPAARFSVWARDPAAARRFADETGARPEDDLEKAVRRAEVIATTTMATAPLIKGEWLAPGTHLDLIGAYRADMREVDSDCFRRGSVFVDSRATTIGHIGELMAPLAEGAISEGDIRADYYDLPSGRFRRNTPEEITLCKNGGGAHLDLMTARYMIQAAAS
ncbi:MAG: ornithine cyclodeaminase [Paracoccaceae bacterium]